MNSSEQTCTESLSEANAELMGQIVDKFLERADRGERPDIEEYARSHPELANVIRKMLPTLEMMQPSGDVTAIHSQAEAASEIRPEGPLGDFRIVRELGRGGMGVVYEATQISLGRTVALKVLPFAAAMDDRQLQRFKNEAQAAACLHHPHIVPVFGVGCDRGVHYYAMQLIEGQSLAAVIGSLKNDPQANGGDPKSADEENAGVLTPPQSDASTQAIAALSTAHNTNSREYFRSIAKLGQQAAEALEHAHQSGVVHRDVKPANLMLDHGGNLWITDFGLAQMQSDTRLTMTGDLMGTLRYMSPEQALAKRVTVDHRTDIYSLGSTIYELLALQPVFTGKDRAELLRQIAFEEPKSVRRVNHAIPVELETIVMKAMCKNPADRYSSSQELADDLQRFLEDKPIKAKRPTLAQHVSRWTRRHRGVATTITAAMVFAIIGLGIAVAVIAEERRKLAEQQQETEDALQDSEALVGQLQVEKGKTLEQLNKANAATLAKEAANHALEELMQLENEARKREQLAMRRERRNSYIHQTMLADIGQRVGDYSRARSLLESTRPEFRGWEWDFLTRKVNDAEFVFRGAATRLPIKARKTYLSPDGEYLAVVVNQAGPSPTQRLQRPRFDLTFLSTSTGKPFFTLGSREEMTVRSERLGNIACRFSPDSHQAAVALFDQDIAVLDLREERQTFTLEGHSDDVTCVSFSGDGRWLASGSVDQTVRIWDLENGECVRVYEGHGQPLRAVAFSPDGSMRIASEAGVWTDDPQLAMLMPKAKPNLAYLGVGSEAFDPEAGGFRISNVGNNTPAHKAGIRADDFVVKINDKVAEEMWSLPEGLSPYSPGEEVRFELLRGDETIQTTVTFGKLPPWVVENQTKEMTVVLAKRADELHIWNASTGETEVPTENARTLCWSPDGEYLAYINWHRGHRQIVVAKRTGEIVTKDRTLKWARFRPDSLRVLLGGERLEEWELATAERLQEFSTSGEYSPIGDYVLQGSHIAVANYGSNQVEIFNAVSGAVVGRRNISNLSVRKSFLVDETGRRFTFEVPGSKVAMWNVRSWIDVDDDAFILDLKKVHKIATSRNGKLVAIAKTSPPSVRLHDAQSGKLVHEFPVTGWKTRQLLFGGDSTQLACISNEGPDDHYVQIWNTQNHQPILEQGPVSGAVKSAIFHQGKLRTLVVEGPKCFVRDVATQETLLELRDSRRTARRRGPFGRPSKYYIDGRLTLDGKQAIIRRTRGREGSSSSWTTDPVEFWSIDTGEQGLVRQDNAFQAAGDWVSPQGNYLLIRDYQQGFMLHDVRANRSYPLEKLGTLRLSQFCWSPDETRLLLLGKGKESRLIDTNTGRELLALPHRPTIVDAVFSESGRLHMTTQDGEVGILNGTPLADDPPRDPKILAMLSWSVAVNPGAETREILQAVEWAKEARERSTGDVYYGHVLGAATYRAGNFRDAVELLASAASHVGRPSPLFSGLARASQYADLGALDRYRWFLAMANWRIGEEDAAMRSFWNTRVSDIEQDPLRSLAKETAELLGVSIQDKEKVEQRLREIAITIRGQVERQEVSREVIAELTILAHDFNRDQKLTENELPFEQWERFIHFDQNQDAAIEHSELLQRLRESGFGERMSFDEWFARRDKNSNRELSKDEVSEDFWNHYKQFDANGDAILQNDEMAQAYPNGVPYWKNAAKRMFAFFDADGDGELSEPEAPTGEFWRQFSSRDVNQDGKLSQSELEAGMDDLGVADSNGSPNSKNGSERFGRGARKVPPAVSLRILDQAFGVNDTDGDGVVTEDEARLRFWNRFRDHDTNQDGKLELEEIRKSLQAEADSENETDSTGTKSD